MPIGHPDYSNTTDTTFISGVNDMGELAARLHSPDTYDRSGNVLYMDNFNYGIASWSSVVSGGGALVTVVTSNTYRGEKAIKLTGGLNGGMYSSIQKPFNPQFASKLGCEIKVAFPGLIDFFAMELRFRLGDDQYDYGIRIDPNDSKLLIALQGAPNPVWTEFVDDITLSSFTMLYHTFKMVVDIENAAYVRFLVDQSEYNISEFTPHKYAAPSSRHHIVAYLACHSRALNNDVAFIDDFIFTFNEP